MCKIQIPENATLDEKRSLCFDALYEMNLGDKVEKKDGLSYLTWSEAWKAFMDFASTHPWRGNFRELNAMLTRLATLAPDGRIDLDTVNTELERSQRRSNGNTLNGKGHDRIVQLLGEDCESRYDLFDIMQLADVVEVCRGCTTLSEAGRKLFAITRQAKTNPNDADRLKKYLAHFNLTFQDVKGM